SVDEIVAVRGAAHRQRPVERQGIGGAGAIALGRHDRDLAHLAQRFGKERDARREITIVVGHQDPHRAILKPMPRRPLTLLGRSFNGKELVGAARFELATTCTPCRYATRLRYAPMLQFYPALLPAAAPIRAAAPPGQPAARA